MLTRSCVVFGNGSAASNSTDVLTKGETYAYFLSEPYSPDNLTQFYQAKDMVHVMMLRGSTINLMCNRAGNGSSLTSAAAAGRSGIGLGVVAVAAGLAALFNVL